jgi:hypothetical protein
VRGRLRPGSGARLPALPGEGHPAREGEHRQQEDSGYGQRAADASGAAWTLDDRESARSGRAMDTAWTPDP